MVHAKLPISFLRDALITATYILNRVPYKFVPSTPYELWKPKKPDFNIMCPWGCEAYVHNISHEYGKLGSKGKKCIFIRYSKYSK